MARSTTEEHLRLSAPADVKLTVTGNHMQPVGGGRTHVEDLTLGEPPTVLCMGCLAAGIAAGAGDGDDR
ncbi:MAG: hypothetical protein DLM61_12360 [Pseudonocardiales bacterium]|nr:MAG: hypothetical protein DLM61_12360 [Pseudonocardiales bacterium]